MKNAHLKPVEAVSANESVPAVKPEINDILISLRIGVVISDTFRLKGNRRSFAIANTMKNLVGVCIYELAGTAYLAPDESLYGQTPTELGAHFGMSAKSMNRKLEELGLQRKNAKGRWELTPEGEEFGEVGVVQRDKSQGIAEARPAWFFDRLLPVLLEHGCEFKEATETLSEVVSGE